jgi:AbrB family looped-hinge helix DNA binding protein
MFVRLLAGKVYARVSLQLHDTLPGTTRMREVISTITSKGQITIPVEIRRHLGVGAGDKITFVIDSSGDVHVKACQYPTIASLRGAAGSLKRPLPWSEVRRIAREDHLRAKNADSDG